MTSRIRPNFDLFECDELAETISESAAASPAFAAAVDDAVELRQVIDQLVRLRKRAGLTQVDLAKLIDVRQPTVSQFETESSDPRLSTLQRYARAIGCRVSMCVVDGEGVFAAPPTYTAVQSQRTAMPAPIEVRADSQAFEWEEDLRRSSYELA